MRRRIRLRQRYLTVVIIGGAVGVELLEVAAFTDDILRFYPTSPRRLRFTCSRRASESSNRWKLAETATRVLRRRGPSGPRPRSGRSSGTGPAPNESVEAGTIVLAAGILPSGGSGTR
jgi:hypothetical protein